MTTDCQPRFVKDRHLTRVRAWDDAWNLTAPVHNLGSQHTASSDEKRCADALGELSVMPLPVEAIYAIANAVRAAWEAGRGQ